MRASRPAFFRARATFAAAWITSARPGPRRSPRAGARRPSARRRSGGPPAGLPPASPVGRRGRDVDLVRNGEPQPRDVGRAQRGGAPVPPRPASSPPPRRRRRGPSRAGWPRGPPHRPSAFSFFCFMAAAAGALVEACRRFSARMGAVFQTSSPSTSTASDLPAWRTDAIGAGPSLSTCVMSRCSSR